MNAVTGQALRRSQRSHPGYIKNYLNSRRTYPLQEQRVYSIVLFVCAVNGNNSTNMYAIVQKWTVTNAILTKVYRHYSCAGKNVQKLQSVIQNYCLSIALDTQELGKWLMIKELIDTMIESGPYEWLFIFSFFT